MNRHKAVLFDVDGVLITPPKLFAEQYCEKYGIDPGEQVKFYATEEFKKASLGEFDLKDALRQHNNLWQWAGTPEELMDLWFEGENYPNNELLDVVRRLKRNVTKVYLATEQERYRKQWLEETVFRNMFDAIFCTCDIGFSKRDNHFWKVVLDQLSKEHPGITPNKIAYFDDKQGLVDKAQEYGIDAHLYTSVSEVEAILTN